MKLRFYRTRCMSLPGKPSTMFYSLESEHQTKGIEILKEEIPCLNEGNHAFVTQEIEEETIC